MFGIDATTPDDVRRRLQRSLGPTLVVAATTWLATLTAARAGPETDYVLSDVSAVFDGTPVSISGSFTIGAGEEWAAQIQLMYSGFPPVPFATNYSCNTCGGAVLSPLSVSPGTAVAFGSDGSSIQISLANSPSTIGSTVPITSIAITGFGTTFTGTNLTGDASVVGNAPDYTFSNASTVLNGKREAISGYFTFDPLTDIEYIAMVNLGGIGSGALDAEPQSPAGNVISVDFGGLNLAQFSFANPLSFGDDPLTGVGLGDGVVGTNPTGFAVGPPAPTVPEPSSFAILGVALGLLSGRRASRRACQAQREQAHEA
jgi:hypothetical protein